MLGELLMNIGTWILCLAAIPQLFSIWKNRHNLRGYSFYGTLTLFVGLLCVALSFFLMEMWISLVAQVIPLTMWFMATWYARNQK